jgi:ABC-type multidrug transport system permease subunit
LGWIGIITLLCIAAGALPFAFSLFCRPQQRLLSRSNSYLYSPSSSSSILPCSPSVSSIVLVVLLLQLMSVALCGYPLPKVLQPTWVAALKPFNIYSHALQVNFFTPRMQCISCHLQLSQAMIENQLANSRIVIPVGPGKVYDVDVQDMLQVLPSAAPGIAGHFSVLRFSSLRCGPASAAASSFSSLPLKFA